MALGSKTSVHSPGRMQPVSTRVHGLVDYASVLALTVAPHQLGWGARARRLLGAAAGATLVYSLFTRYELGLIRLLPMPVHLALDAAQATVLCAVPVFLRRERPAVRAAIIGIGLGELTIVALSRSRPPSAVAP
jgi:hypothetical protein